MSITVTNRLKMDEETFPSRDEAIDFGKDYEYLMAAYYALVFTFNDEVDDFKLSTNNKDMGDFDDVVIEIELKNGEEHLFALQLKHVARTIALITLTTDNKKFSLEKYSHEFKKIKTGYEKSRSYSAPFENFHFVLYSNSVLEKFEEIDEDGKRLETIVDKKTMKKGDSHITIQRCNNCIGRNLLNLCDVDDNFIYKFKTDKEGSVHEEFFKQFSFYTRQKNAKEVQWLIGEIIFNKFQNCDSDVVMSYLNYFTYWCRRDYGAFKLTKSDIKLKLVELVLSSYIPQPDLKNLEHFSSDKNNLIFKVFAKFDIILMEDASETSMNRIWDILLKSFAAFSTTWSTQFFIDALDEMWTKPVPGIYISDFMKKIDIPISAQTEHFSELSPKRIYVLLWHSDLVPLIIKFRGDSTDQNILLALELCKHKKKKFIMLDTNIFKNKPGWRVFRDLSDLLKFGEIYGNVTEKLSVSLQGRPNVSLKQFLTNDDRLLKIISFNQILQLLDDKLVIGDDCKKNIPKYYVPRHIPKILLNAKAIDEIENDLFIFVYKSINKSAHLRFKKKTIDLEKYLLLKKKKNIDISVSCTDQFFSSFSDNLVILARYTCTEEQFQEVCSINQFKNCHHVKMIDDETIEWIQSRGSIRRLRQYQLDFEDFKTDQFVQDVDVLYHFNNKVNMIVANPGMGKTVTTEVLKSICPSSHWVITISLNYHAKFFEVNHSNTEVLQYFLNIENKHYLAGEAAKVFFSNKKVLFLWDSFDELPRNCVESVISTIKNLSSDGYLQWIFTRHSSKEFLEDTFDVFALTLTQFSPQNQHDYIYNHLKEKYEDEEKIQNIIYKINEINSLTSNYLDYSGTPLHIHMMVQIFINNLQIQTDKITTVTGMYQEFIQGKFDCMFKKAEADLENYHMQQIQEQFKRAQLSLYKIASLKASFDEEIFATLSLNCNQLLEELSESEDGLGLIIGVNDYQKPVFVHKSYEEFLTALWLSENHRKHQDLITTWFQERYTNIRLMFDMLLAQNSPPHLAVLHRNLNTLEKVKDDIANCKDIAGRTALHVAAAWGRRHPLIKTAKSDYEKIVVNRSPEETHQRYQDTFKILASYQKALLPQMEALTLKDFEAIDRFMDNLPQVVDTSSSLADHPNKVLIFAEANSRVVEEDEVCLTILKFLLEHNSNPLDKDQMLQLDSFQYADETLSLAAIDLMLTAKRIDMQRLKNCNHIPTLLHYAVKFSYNSILESIDDIPYIEYKHKRGKVTFLQHAAEANNVQAVKKLLKIKLYKDLIDTESAFSGNPLSSASFHGNIEMVNVLLENGAKVNGHKSSPLFAAVFGGHQKCCEKLLDVGAEVNATSPGGSTPLLTAANLNLLNIMKLLLNHNANVNYSNEEFTALDYAIKHHNLDMVHLLLDHQPDINRQSKTLGYTALHCASHFGNLETLRVLLKHGADTKIKSKNLMTPLHVALINKNEEHALELIKADPSVINEFAESHLTPIALAAANNYSDVIEVLVKNGANINSEGDVSPLHIAAGMGFDASVKALIRAGALVNEAVEENRIVPLFCSLPHLSTLKILLDNSADVNFKNKFGRTAVHLAVMNAKLDATEELLKRCAAIDIKDEENWSPLYCSVYFKHTKMTKFLLDHGASVDEGGKLLCEAAKQNLPECILLLLEYGVEVNALDDNKTSALFQAVLTRADNCVKILLEKGANPDIGKVDEPSNISPLLSALTLHETVIVKQLIDAGANTSDILDGSLNALHVAALTGDIFSVILLIEAGIDVNVADKRGRTPLHYTTEISEERISWFRKRFSNTVYVLDEECAKELILHGASVNQRDDHSLTPLHLACHLKRSRLIQLLIDHGADVNSTDYKNQSPVHQCFAVGAFDDVGILAKNGARLDTADKFGKPPTVYAMEYIHKNGLQNMDVLKKLQELGVDIDLPDESGMTLLHKAVYENNSELVDYLLDNGVDAEKKTYEGNYTPLVCAVIANRLEILKLFATKLSKASLNDEWQKCFCYAAVKNFVHILKYLHASGLAKINNGGEINQFTPLHCACYVGCYESAVYLIENGADIEAKSADGCCPLYLSCNAGHLNLVELLVEHNAKIDEFDHNGNTGLFSAASNGHLEIVKFLHENGARLHMVDNDGDTPLHDAAANGHLTVVQYLASKNANLQHRNKKGKTPLDLAVDNVKEEIVKFLKFWENCTVQ